MSECSLSVEMTFGWRELNSAFGAILGMDAV